MNRGFIVLAQNTNTVDYVKCAEALALSVKNVMPNSKISLVTNNTTSLSLWDQVIPLPYGDQDPNSIWKLENDWQIYDASPYEFTIKLEADLYIPTSIEYYWDILLPKNLVVCTTIRDFKQKIITRNPYRQLIIDNKLPNCYNAITYFKKSNLAEKFFKIIRNIFADWEEYKTILKCKPSELPTTDWVYSLACHILGVENTTLPNFTQMSMIHMKPYINNFSLDDWTKTLIYEINKSQLKINTLPQLYPFHYVKKDFANKIIEVL